MKEVLYPSQVLGTHRLQYLPVDSSLRVDSNTVVVQSLRSGLVRFETVKR